MMRHNRLFFGPKRTCSDIKSSYKQLQLPSNRNLAATKCAKFTKDSLQKGLGMISRPNSHCNMEKNGHSPVLEKIETTVSFETSQGHAIRPVSCGLPAPLSPLKPLIRIMS
jgi:hypothetical protein